MVVVVQVGKQIFLSQWACVGCGRLAVVAVFKYVNNENIRTPVHVFRRHMAWVIIFRCRGRFEQCFITHINYLSVEKIRRRNGYNNLT